MFAQPTLPPAHTHTQRIMWDKCVCLDVGCAARGSSCRSELSRERPEKNVIRPRFLDGVCRLISPSHPLTPPPHLSPPSATEPGSFSINPVPLSFQSHVWSRETGGPSLTNPPTSEFGRVLGNMNPLCWDSPQNQILNRLWLFSVCTNQNTDIKIVQVKTKIIHSLLREVNRNEMTLWETSKHAPPNIFSEITKGLPCNEFKNWKRPFAKALTKSSRRWLNTSQK